VSQPLGSTVNVRPSSSPCRNPVMVYGSLMSGMSNHSLMANEDIEFAGLFESCDYVRLFSLGAFPGIDDAIYSSTSVDKEISRYYGILEGELYWVTDGALEMLDRFEGTPDFYQRKALKIRPRSHVRSVENYEARSWEELRITSLHTYSAPCWGYVLNEKLWDQKTALLPVRHAYKPVHNWSVAARKWA